VFAQRSHINHGLKQRFERWKGDNIDPNTSLVLDLLHPISEEKLQTHVAWIHLKEAVGGFRVVYVETVQIDSLDQDLFRYVGDRRASYDSKMSHSICCSAIYFVDATDADGKDIGMHIVTSFFYGDNTNFEAVQRDAEGHAGCQSEVIRKLNKE
jgi:hypothetical protein